MVYTHLKSKCQSRFNTGSSQDLFDRDLLSDRPEMAATLGPHGDFVGDTRSLFLAKPDLI